MASLRERQIREVLDEDLKAYREVLFRQVKQAKIMNETYAPPNRFEKRVAFQIDQYFLKLQRHADDIVNNLANGDYAEKGVKDLLYSYQELIAYLDTYAAQSPINQRDKAIIENKFDAIENQVDQISSFADSLGWRSRDLIAELSDILDYRTYLPIVNLPFTKGIVSKEFAERGFNDPMIAVRERSMFPAREGGDDDEPPAYEFAPEGEFGSIEQVDEDISQMATSSAAFSTIPKPKNLTQAKDYMKTLSMCEVRRFTEELDMTDALKAKRSKSGLRQKLTLNDIIRIYMLKEQGIKTTKNRQPIVEDPETLLEQEEIGADFETRLLEEEEEEAPAVEGNGMSGGANENIESVILKLARRFNVRINLQALRDRIQELRQQRFTYRQIVERIRQDYDLYGDNEIMEGEGLSGGFGMRGMGESEDMMFGLPQGYKKAMRLRPMDRTPVHFKTQDERKEDGLSLEDRMEFLNQLDTRPIKEDMKVNSTGTYKKSMSEKAKKLAKYYS